MKTMDDIYNADTLYDSFLEIRKPIKYKKSVQLYGFDALSYISDTIKAHEDGTTAYHKGVEFTISERGKVRHITPVPFKERVPVHALCKEILIPELRKKLIYDNCASLKGRGIDMQRDRVVVHLKRYYARYGTNEGYALFSDFSKYFDNLDHELLIKEMGKVIKDEEVLKEVQLILDAYKIDGSKLSDEEFELCKNGVYDSNKYYRNPKQGPERYINKSVGIGSELSQIAGVYYPTRIDNYVKIVRGCTEYGRYNDDFYIFHPDKEFLLDVFEGIKAIAKELKLHINERKTRLVKLNQPFVFLKVRYHLTETGKVTRSYTAKTFIRERRKLKKFKKKLDAHELTMETIEAQYRSWRGRVMRCRNKQSKNAKPMYSNWKAVQTTDKLFKELFGYLPK